jgi:autotransporter translocation and assembly factor TamB
VATGRPPDEGGDVSTVPSAQAASLLGGFLADRLQRTLMRRLPIDVLNIDPGDGLRSTQLEAGTYLGDDLYVAYVGRLGGEDPFLRENQNELQLEYRLSQRWSFEAVYGDARRGSADIVWTRRY